MKIVLNSDQIVTLLSRYRFPMYTEAALQNVIEELFEREGVAYEREVRLSGKERIDFMVGDVGVEVKVGHPLASVIRQLYRYAQLDSVRELVLVSNRCRHTMVPPTINGKPVAVVFLAWGALG